MPARPPFYSVPPLFYILLLCCLYYLCIVRGRQHMLALEGVGWGVLIRGEWEKISSKECYFFFFATCLFINIRTAIHVISNAVYVSQGQ